ncbi:MAG: hypothetical protein RIT81_31350 [Deltaproteobacteria bacterium]
MNVRSVTLLFVGGCVPLLPVEDLGPCSSCQTGEICDVETRTCRTPSSTCEGDECVRYRDVAGRWGDYCAVLESGRVACWGQGVGSAPRLIEGITDAERVVVAYDEACALRADRSVACWDIPVSDNAEFVGRASDAQFGGPVRSLVVGTGHKCALLEDGRVQCEGNNDAGRFGSPEPADATTPRTIQLDARLGPITDIVGSRLHTCFQHGAGGTSLTCYGADVASGAEVPFEATFVFDDVRSVEDNAIPVVLTSTGAHYLDLPTAKILDTDPRDRIVQTSGACSLIRGGSVECRYIVGSEASFFGTHSDPIELVDASVAQVARTPWTLAMRYEDGTIRTLGSNRHGRAGTGEVGLISGRSVVPLARAPESVATGTAAACAITDGRLDCWGQSAGQFGHLGREGADLPPRPVELGDGNARQAVLFGSRANMQMRGLAVLVERTEARTVEVFGPPPLAGFSNWGWSREAVYESRRVSALDDAEAIAAGTDVLCGRFGSGPVVCVDPVRVQSFETLSGATEIAVHPRDAFVLGVVRGGIVCVPLSGVCSPDLALLRGVQSVEVGDSFFVTRQTDGSVIHISAAGLLLSGQPIPEAFGALSISASTNHACAARGELGPSVCWGENDEGAIDPDRPQMTSDPDDPYVLDASHTQIEAGPGFTCAVELDGVLGCWGTNEFCQLGGCSKLFHDTPTLIAEPR